MAANLTPPTATATGSDSVAYETGGLIGQFDPDQISSDGAEPLSIDSSSVTPPKRDI
jgi:hypothetical protein